MSKQPPLSYNMASQHHERTQPNMEASELVKALNTAFLTTQNSQKQLNGISSKNPADLAQIFSSPAYQALLNALKTMSEQSSLSANEAAEELVMTFKKLDAIWTQYLIQEGLNRLKS